MGSRRVRQDWVAFTFTSLQWGIKAQPLHPHLPSPLSKPFTCSPFGSRQPLQAGGSFRNTLPADLPGPPSRTLKVTWIERSSGTSRLPCPHALAHSSKFPRSAPRALWDRVVSCLVATFPPGSPTEVWTQAGREESQPVSTAPGD